MGSGFGGLQGRGARRQDPAIERELALSLEELFHGCTKKMKISRRVIISYFPVLIVYVRADFLLLKLFYDVDSDCSQTVCCGAWQFATAGVRL